MRKVGDVIPSTDSSALSRRVPLGVGCITLELSQSLSQLEDGPALVYGIRLW
jgi:hypothetical protein